jgi:small-conductance mechanosensitive channel
MIEQDNISNIIKELQDINNKIQQLSTEEKRILFNSLNNEKDVLSNLIQVLNYKYDKNTKSKKNQVEEFGFNTIMPKLRHAILHDFKETNNIAEIDWLLKIKLQSRSLFNTTKEADIFLSNITGFVHNTKSTCRDRIVDWYFNRIKELDIKEQKIIYFKISKYLFINIPSNYKEWKNLIFKGGK